MVATIADMTREELREMIEGVIEQKLFEIFGDPDEDMEMREEISIRLQQQKRSVVMGECGRLFDDVVKEIWNN